MSTEKDCVFYSKGNEYDDPHCSALNCLYCSFEDKKCRFYKCNREWRFDSSTEKVYKYIN